MKMIIDVEFLGLLRDIGYLTDTEYERAMSGDDPRFRSYVDDDFLPMKPTGLLNPPTTQKQSKR